MENNQQVANEDTSDADLVNNAKACTDLKMRESQKSIAKPKQST